MPRRPHHFLNLALGLLVICQMALAQVLAASPALHEECHNHQHHEDEPQTCVVELMLLGGYGCEIPSVTPVDIAPERSLTDFEICPSRDFIPRHFLGVLLADAPPRGP